ncbi:unnamed protein product, partial [marine sediment metagenome]
NSPFRGLKETEIMQMRRKQDAEINKEKCKSMIFRFLYSNQGKNHIQVNEIKKSVPNPILMNIPEHFNDILVELLQENNISGKVVGDELFLE